MNKESITGLFLLLPLFVQTLHFLSQIVLRYRLGVTRPTSTQVWYQRLTAQTALHASLNGFMFMAEKMFTLQPDTSSAQEDSTQQLSQYLTEVQATSASTIRTTLSFRKNKSAIYLKPAPASLDILVAFAFQAYAETFLRLWYVDNRVQE